MYRYRRIIVSVVAVLLALLLVGGMILSAVAASSSEIKKRIEDLKKQESSIVSQQQAIRSKMEDNESDIMDLVEKKNQIDQQIKLTQDSIENKTEQIQAYNLLLAQKQNELDDALESRDALNERFKTRIRAMEENGKLTYWSILFQAGSFSDLLDRVDMINEIARADSKMIQQIQEVAQQIETARQELAVEKVELEQAREALSAEEETLSAQRAESDEVFAELMADHKALEDAELKYESQKEALLAQIAKEQVKYQDAVAAEEKARKEAEAAARARAAAAAAAAANRQNNASGRSNTSSSSSNSSSSNSSSNSSSSSSSSSSGRSSGSASFSVSGYGFSWPTDTHYITCEFGPRYHPITGKYGNHSGMDIGATYGSPIYACASGTVTTAEFGTVYGYHVVINHGNGFSTLYGHMCRYTVSSGQYVTRGEIIGYVGSTGWSTAPHLHLTMYKNSSLVNPKAYLP